MSGIGRRLAYVEGRIAPRDYDARPVQMLLVEPFETHEAAAARQGIDRRDTSKRLIVVQFVLAIDGKPAPGQILGGDHALTADAR
jgi:hypothetical protein